MNERIKAVRKCAGLKQSEFAERLGIKPNTVTSYETGLRVPSDAIVTSICREFRVREEWLRTGEGEMFLPVDADEELEQIIDEIKVSDDELIRAIIKGYWRLDEKGKAAVKSLVKDLAAAVDKEKAPGQSPGAQGANEQEETTAYRETPP